MDLYFWPAYRRTPDAFNWRLVFFLFPETVAMGTFMGHFLPGSFFAVFAIWWIFSALHRFYRGRYHKGPVFRATLTYPCLCCCSCLSRHQIEGFMKLFFTSIGLAGEIITGMRHGTFALVGNKQHATMFAFFGVSGIVDIMMHHKVPLPKFTDYVFNILCFAVEGLLFMFHLHGRSVLDKSVHHLLVYVIWGCAFATLVEMRFPKNIFCCLTRCFFVLLQGTWFIQVGAILYPPFKGMKQWKGDNHDDIMIVAIIFAWHMFFIFLFMCATAILMVRIHGRGTHSNSSASSNGLIRLNAKRSGDQIGLMESDEDEDDDVELGVSTQEDTKLVRPNWGGRKVEYLAEALWLYSSTELGMVMMVIVRNWKLYTFSIRNFYSCCWCTVIIYNEIMTANIHGTCIMQKLCQLCSDHDTQEIDLNFFNIWMTWHVQGFYDQFMSLVKRTCQNETCFKVTSESKLLLANNFRLGNFCC